MRVVISCLLLLTLALQVNYTLTYFLVFKLNQENLSAEVCERVVKNCNACCYLNKKMAEEDDTKNTTSSTRQTLKISEYTFAKYLLLPSDNTEKEIYFHSQNFSSLEGFTFIPEHPPNV